MTRAQNLSEDASFFRDARFLLSRSPPPSLPRLFRSHLRSLLPLPVPYASFVAFFDLYLGVVLNPSLSHYVRFNVMQAVTLDVLLVLPLLLRRIFSPGRVGVGFQVMVWGHNLLFVFSALCFVYSFGCCVLGRTPHLPFVADAAGRQL